MNQQPRGLIEAVMLGVMLGVVGCTEPSTPTTEARSDPSPATTPATTTPPATDDPTAIPEDWVWVTESRSRFEVAMPALPTSKSTRPDDPRALPTRILTATRGSATYSITTAPSEGPGTLDQLRSSLAQYGTPIAEVPWNTDGFGVDVATPSGTLAIRAVVGEDRLYVLEVVGGPAVVDRERYFGSFSVRAKPRAEELSAPKRRYRVQAPARMGAWRDTSGIPPLIGHRGMLDGHQLVIHATELLFVPDAEKSLDGSVTAMRRSMNGTLEEIDPRPFGGRPSRRVEFRAGDGMYATVRAVLDGSRLVMAAVYAPSGREAPWADAFVDSLSPEPSEAP